MKSGVKIKTNYYLASYMRDIEHEGYLVESVSTTPSYYLSSCISIDTYSLS